ncbi:hypothetical protein DSCA_53740 [Desulfosarcina alkanivorans]|jgi:pyruvate/2-oxoglutarate dehydrogenase complex dihydrolipoamide dehydrogenase (E3) component|uniref:FAD dependent oxidoreductase domain-containing protein n=1 Tax=Desulfosarcina alkanivorans TaxID=571177 RepID=A0A5K7YYN8_9BACT|nr:hypothetical protein DSCA_53740 [Desulfosarcina alkanivorans]
MKNYDAVAVGAGTAGQTAAHELRAHGLEVALVDNSGRPGGSVRPGGVPGQEVLL